MSEQLPSYEHELEKAPTEEALRRLGAACLASTVDPSVLAAHTEMLDNPNDYIGKPLFSGGEIPAEVGEVYRQVGLEAIEDLAQSGIVRNGHTARGEKSRRWGDRVFWSSGEDGKTVTTGGRAVIVASEEAASKGWVTMPDVHAVYTKTDTGELINILDSNET